MKYTISSEGDRKIEQDMKEICAELLNRIKDVEAIMLTGGFSRGEGPVKLEGKKVFPYNDYDIQVISNTKYSKEETDKLATEISRKLGYGGIGNFYPFKKEEQKMKDNFYVDLKIDSVKALKKMLPRIRTYELRNNSMILHGKDLRSFIPDYKMKDIPLSEGAKLLLDRMSQLAEYYSTEKKHDKEFLTYIIQQAYASCCTALLLLSGKYEIGYKKSAEILKASYKEDFPELYNQIPNLTEKIEEFLEWKLNPKKKEFADAEKEWFTAKRNIILVSMHFFSRFLKKNIATTDELSDAILNMKKEFYSPYLREMVKKKIKIGLNLNKVLLPFALKILRKKYIQRLKGMGINFEFNDSFAPDLIIFSSLIFLIDCIKEDSINEATLEKAKARLERVYPVKGSNWEEISRDYANAYIAFFLQKIQ